MPNTTSPRRQRRVLAAAAATTAAVLSAGVLGGAATAHDGDPHDGTAYTPPPVVDAGPVTGSFRNTPASARHEVWLVDQSDTRRDGDAAANVFASYGGTVHVYDGADLRRDATTAPAERVDLGGATAALCRASTGANPVRPHMLSFSPDDSHAILAFVTSGHVVVFDAAAREPVACFRTEPGAGGARQAHAALPTPDGRYVLVANQNGKKLERIRTDYAAGVFTQEPEATLDLTAGTTPNGMPMQTPGDPTVRPDNAPICPFVPSTGYPAFVSLRGGGLFAVDPYAERLRVVAEYPATEVARDGCGFTEAAGWVYGNGGSNPGNLSGWFQYRLPVGEAGTYSAANPPSMPAVDVVDHDTRGPRDAHGVATVARKYVWAFDRAAHVVQVYDASTAETVVTVNLRTAGSQRPAPDIADVSPDGRAVYASTRGPNPLTGTHAAVGDAPGVLVLEAGLDGRTPAVRGHAGISNVVAGVERADPHGLAVRVIR
ncbi:hypothetical protein ACK8HX_02360 [Oryzobacter sp. R7]|uniref:hypothetical protein n=1 Tax=Oryzobacter faecalis TaxID=3388656 RepID=UPI00398C985C